MNETSESSNPLSGPAICPECGAINSVGSGQCWLCHRPLGGTNAATAKVDSAVAKPIGPPRPLISLSRGPATFSLATLMLLITLAAVFCGLTAAAPGLGIPLAVLITPALIRTFAASNVSRSQGIEPTAEAKIATFFASIGLMFLIMIAGFAVFFIGCCAAFSSGAHPPGNIFNDPSMAVFVLTGIAVIVVMVWLFIRAWPRSSQGAAADKKPPRI